MAKLKVPFVPPSTFKPVDTVTVSPGANGVSDTKLAPWPSESPATTPVCAPVIDPVTVTAPIADGATPRNTICSSRVL